MRSLKRFALRRSPWLAGGVAGVMLVSWVASVVGIFAMHLDLTDLILWPAIASFAVCGWVLAARRPDNAVGWLLLMTAFGLSFLPWSVLSGWLLRDHIDAGRWIAGFAQASFIFDVGGLALLLPLLFPDGRLPSRRRWWRVVLVADVLYMGLAAANLFEPATFKVPGYRRIENPFALPDAKTGLGVVIASCVPFLMIGFVGSFASVVSRWRGAGPAQRAQVKWVILALLVAPVPFFLHDYWQAGSDVTMTFILPLVPIAVAVSVLRYRLYEIDRIVSRAVSYLVITGLLVGVYVGCIAVADMLLPVGSSFGVAASTLAAAALFQPVRRRVQAGVDRRFNRQRYDAARTVDAFAVRLRDEVDPDVVRSDLVSVAAQAIQPASVSLWVAS